MSVYRAGIPSADERRAMAQAAIDEARRKLAARAAEREAEKAEARAQFEEKMQAAREKEQREAAASFDRRHKLLAKRSYLDTGASEEEFEKAWPELREEIRKKEIAEGMAKRERVTSAIYRSNF